SIRPGATSSRLDSNMSLFNWLTGSKQPERMKDCIWLTKRAKYQGLINRIRDTLAKNRECAAIMVVAHFPDCLAELHELIVGENFDDQRLHLTLCADLSRRSIPIGEGSTLFLVAEKHPLRTYDEQVLEYARNQTGPWEAVFHVSLEDAMLR